MHRTHLVLFKNIKVNLYHSYDLSIRMSHPQDVQIVVASIEYK